MPQYNLKHLNRKEYVDSIEGIPKETSTSFANMALKWWDEQFGWYIKGCVVLRNEEDEHLCYIFFKTDKSNEYITIHNIFTPQKMRRNGYGAILMSMIFTLALTQKISRFRLTCVSTSLDFYLSLGFVYWGVNSVGDYYCDLPMPLDGLEGVRLMTETFTSSELMGKKMATIYKKTQHHSEHLSKKQQRIYDLDILKLDKSYLLASFMQSMIDKEI